MYCCFQLQKSGKEPKAGAELSLKNISYRTKVRSSNPDTFILMLLNYQRLTKESCLPHKVVNRSTSPQWDEAFHFLIHNPTEDTLIVKVRIYFTVNVDFKQCIYVRKMTFT